MATQQHQIPLQAQQVALHHPLLPKLLPVHRLRRKIPIAALRVSLVVVFQGFQGFLVVQILPVATLGVDCPTLPHVPPTESVARGVATWASAARNLAWVGPRSVSEPTIELVGLVGAVPVAEPVVVEVDRWESLALKMEPSVNEH